MRRRTALAMVAILCALFQLPRTSATPSRVMEMSFEDFDDNNVPVYDGPGDFISLAFYSTWDLRVSKMQRPACMFRARLTLFFLFLSFFFEIK